MIPREQNNQEEFVTETHFCSFMEVTAVWTRSCRWCRWIKNWCSWQRKTSQLWGAARKGSHEKLRTIWNVAWSEKWAGVRVNKQERKSSECLSRCANAVYMFTKKTRKMFFKVLSFDMHSGFKIILIFRSFLRIFFANVLNNFSVSRSG